MSSSSVAPFTPPPPPPPPPPTLHSVYNVDSNSNNDKWYDNTTVMAALKVVMSALLFSLSSLGAHVWTSHTRNPEGAVTFVVVSLFRFGFQVVIGSIVLIMYHLSPFHPFSAFFILRGLFGGLGLICLYLSLSLISLGEATVLFFTTPIFVGMLAHFFLNEEWHWWDKVSSVVVIVGCIFVMQPAVLFNPSHHTTRHDQLHVVGCSIALLGALGSGSVYISIRKSGVSTSSHVLVWWYGTMGFVMSLLLIPIFADEYGGSSNIIAVNWTVMNVILAVAVPLGGYLSTILFHQGAQQLPAATSSILRTVDLVFAYVWQLSLLSTQLSLLGIIGVVLVAGSVFTSGFLTWQKSQVDAKKKETTTTKPKHEVDNNDNSGYSNNSANRNHHRNGSGHETDGDTDIETKHLLADV